MYENFKYHDFVLIGSGGFWEMYSDAARLVEKIDTTFLRKNEESKDKYKGKLRERYLLDTGLVKDVML